MLTYNADRAAIEISVGELCRLALMSGDLDRALFRAGAWRLKEGSSLHAMLQQAAGPDYQAEVYLTHSEMHDGLTYTVSGRADGVMEHRDGRGICVEEIKSVRGGMFYMPPPDVYTAQLRCYAHFLCASRGLTQIDTCLTYIHADTHELRRLERTERAEDLAAYFADLLCRIAPRARLAVERQVSIPDTLRALPFPYPSLRAGQEELIHTCRRAIRTGRRLFAQAPTGIGKTMSTLYPAVRALGDGMCDKIFYLTAKASTSAEAFRAARHIHESGGKMRTVMLTAKEQICLCPAVREEGRKVSDCCNAIDCPYADGYYDRVGIALKDLLSQAHGYSRALITEVARRHRVCPYELSLDLSELCELIICDYNYVFDPAVRLRRYFGQEAPEGQKYVFLIDEAHNLPDRAREIYSSTLSRVLFEQVYAVLPAAEELNAVFEEVILTLRGLRKLCRDTLSTDAQGQESGYYLSRAPIPDLAERVRRLYEACSEWMWKCRQHPLRPEIERAADAARDFLRVAETYDERFLTYVEIFGGDTTVKLYCLDPSHLLDLCMRKARSSILFSATLTPTDYFADVLGGGKGALQLSLPSPYDPAHLCLAAVDGISTRYEDREKSLRKIVSCIAATVSGRVGNYIVYFPSYSYMEQVRDAFVKKYPSVPLIVQERSMSPRRRESFLSQFADDDKKLRVGFCVLGGSFSEGVDLPGRRLIGTVIVGVGLPGLSNERNILKEYFDGRCERGYDYAYTYPGMNRVLQAAGRVIRREEDEGVVVLIDDRYATPQYQMLFPASWMHLQYAGNAISLAELVKNFWKNRKNATKN